MVQFFLKHLRRCLATTNQLDHVGRNMNRLGGIEQRSLDGLFDPPRGICGESRALCRIETFNCADETNIAFFDQVWQRYPAVHISLGNRDHQSEIGSDHPILRSCIVVVDDEPTKLTLFKRSQQCNETYLAHIHLDFSFYFRLRHANLSW